MATASLRFSQPAQSIATMCSLSPSILSPWKWPECEVNAIPRASSPTFCSLPPLYRDQLRRRHLELDRALFDGLSLVHPSTSPSGLALAAALKISTTTAAAVPAYAPRQFSDGSFPRAAWPLSARPQQGDPGRPTGALRPGAHNDPLALCALSSRP